MKKSRFSLILLTLSTLSALFSMAHAQPGTFAQPSFNQLMSNASTYEQKKQGSIARIYFQQALQNAQNDDERAQAQLGIARNTAIRLPNADPQDDGAAKNAEYLKVLDMFTAPVFRHTEARLGIARVQAELGRYEQALALLTLVLATPEAQPQQKVLAKIWGGQALIELKRHVEARAMLNDFLQSEELTTEQKTVGYRHLARSYLAENNAAAAQAELAKTVAFPDLTDQHIADIYLANGRFLNGHKLHAAARREYEKVAVLADVTSDRNVSAQLAMGQSYFDEQNFAAARATWEQAGNMRGAQDFQPEIWFSVGQARVADKDYAAAREAYEKRLAVPRLEIKDKVETWQHIADTYIQEKNFVAAREALGNIGKGAPPDSGLHLNQQFNIADVYRAENDFDSATRTYKEILQVIADYAAKWNGRKTSDHYSAQDMIEEIAAQMAKEPASMAAAYSLYEALEQHHPYDKEDAEANLGMGDILLAQGKREEARAKYQKALDLRKNYDEGKLAQKKLDELN